MLPLAGHDLWHLRLKQARILCALQCRSLVPLGLYFASVPRSLAFAMRNFTFSYTCLVWKLLANRHADEKKHAVHLGDASVAHVCVLAEVMDNVELISMTRQK